MITTTAKWVIIAFGIFIICAGIIMLVTPNRARHTLRKAASTNFINYAEITLRMIPATALILYADFSKYPLFFKLFGWTMLVTSIILYFIPRKIHFNFASKCADILKPLYFQIISPFAFLFGVALIYSVI